MGINSILTTLLLMVSLMGAVQPIAAQNEAARRAEFKEKIGLDMSVPDFNTQKIDAKVMGKRLAGILDFLMENYRQGFYDRKLGLIASEQNEALENVYVQINKLKFLNAVKRGDEITISMRIDLHKNAANVKRADISFHFVDGVSESDKVNEWFAYISN